MPPFVHLHCHSHYSLLDGASPIDKLIARAKSLEMNALAITDHGNLHGALEFYQEAKKAGINPILGYEAYVAPGKRTNREGAGQKESSYHLTLLAQNRTGFRNLVKMASLAYLEGFYVKPRIDRELLEQHHEGIICLSGCVSSEFSRALLKGQEPGDEHWREAEQVAAWFHKIFGNRYFIEVQNNGLDIQRRQMESAVQLAHKWACRWSPPPTPTTSIKKIPMLKMCSCALTPANSAATPIACGWTPINSSSAARTKCMQPSPASKKHLSNRSLSPTASTSNSNSASATSPTTRPPKNKPRPIISAICVSKACASAMPIIPTASSTANSLPTCSPASITNSTSSTRSASPTTSLSFGISSATPAERNIPATARGSGVGSLVAYALHLSHVCPLDYDLLFERFLDTNRREAPDIDIDFCKDRRGEVIQYVKDKYGEANVAQIGTFGTLAARAAIRDVGRALAIPIPRVDTIVAMVPDVLNISLDEALEQSADLKKTYNSDGEVRELLDLARKIEGLARNVGTHAAAVVIADRPLTEYVPLCRVQNKEEIITQWAMADVEKAGLFKMDFLGLRNLTVLSKAVEIIEQTTGKRVDPYKFPLDDAETFALLCRGETKGIFQLESGGIRDLLQKMKPDHFRDIIATNALYRPGPLEGGMVDDYVQVKHGRKKAAYIHPVMKDVLEETHGVMVYQEQVMLILNRLGGIDLADAYTCIKAISKKNLPTIAKYREQFVTGATSQGLSERQAAELFELIAKFAGYGFNKSHSTAYALIAYMTAYLKAHYPLEFMAALFAGDIDARNFKKKDSLVEHLEDCRRMGLEIVPPNVNLSAADFSVHDGKIAFALAAIKGCGGAAADAIVAPAQSRRAVPQPVRFLRALRSIGRESHGASKA